VIDGSEMGQRSTKLLQSRKMAPDDLHMRTTDGINGIEPDDESYNPCGEAVHLKNTT